MTDTQGAARFFRALSVESRLEIARLLKDRWLCVNALAGRLRITAAAVSQHLRVLRNERLVMSERRGTYVHYRLDLKTLSERNRAAVRLLGRGNRDSRSRKGKR